jgi:hypothetical protein
MFLDADDLPMRATCDISRGPTTGYRLRSPLRTILGRAKDGSKSSTRALRLPQPRVSD